MSKAIFTITQPAGAVFTLSPRPLVAAPASAPVNTTAPAITGTFAEGETLSVSNGTWTGNPAPTFAYQWTRDGTDISGATSSTYALVGADVGAVVDCDVTGTNSEGSAEVSATGQGTVSAATSFTVYSDSSGQSNGVGIGQIANLTTASQYTNANVKFAVDGTADTYESLDATDPSSEYDSSGISHITGEMAQIASSYGGSFNEWLWVKECGSGTPITGTAPGGNLYNKADFNLRETISDTVSSASETRVSSHAIAQGENEAEAAESAAETSTGSTDQATVMPVAVADAGMQAWSGHVAQHRRVRREYTGIRTAPYIIMPFVLPDTDAYDDNAERCREVQRQNAINLGRRVTYDEGTDTATIHAAANEQAVTWDTGTDAPIYTDQGAAHADYDANTYYLDIRLDGTGQDGSPDRLHWGQDAYWLIGKAKAALLKQIYGGNGAPPAGNAFDRVRPVFETTPYVDGTITETSIPINLVASEVGTAHIAAYTSGSAVPTEAEVVAGNGTGFVAKVTGTTRRRNDMVSAASLTGLAAGTEYDIYVVIDFGGNYSVVSLDVRGDALSATTSAASGFPTVQDSQSGSSGGDVTINYTALENDTALLWVVTADQAVTTPTGWTLVATATTGNTGNLSSTAVSRLTLFSKDIGASDSGSVTVDDPGNFNASGVNIIRGGGTITSATNNTDGTATELATAHSAPDLGSASANSLIFAAAADSIDSTTSNLSGVSNAGLSSLTTRIDLQANASNGGGLHVVSGTLAAGGNTGTTDFTFTTQSGVAAITVAIAPA